MNEEQKSLFERLREFAEKQEKQYGDNIVEQTKWTFVTTLLEMIEEAE